MKSLFDPKNILITGVSLDPEKLASYVLRNIVFSNFKEKVFPIAKDIDEIYGLKTIDSIEKVDAKIDLAILVNEKNSILNEVEECAKKQIKNICIIQKGFSEEGEAGYAIERKISQIAAKNSMNIIGPKSLGLILPKIGLNASFANKMPAAGSISIFSQSGGVINALIDFADYYKLGFQQIIGLGNMSAINVSKFLHYYNSLNTSEKPIVLGLYLESITNIDEFINESFQLSKEVPIILLMPKQNRQLRNLFQSHTGSLIQKEDAIDLILSKTGIVRTYSLEEFFYTLLLFSWQTIPKNNAISIISNTGTGNLLVAQQLIENNFDFQNLKVLNKFEEDLPKAKIVDLSGQATPNEILEEIDKAGTEKEVGAIILVISEQSMTEMQTIAETVSRVARNYLKPLIVIFLGYKSIEKCISIFSKHFIPSYNSIVFAIRALKNLFKYSNFKKSQIDNNLKFNISLKKQIATVDIFEKSLRKNILRIRLDKAMTIANSHGLKTSEFQKFEFLSKENLENFQVPFSIHFLKNGKSFFVDNEASKNFLANSIFSESISLINNVLVISETGRINSLQIFCESVQVNDDCPYYYDRNKFLKEKIKKLSVFHNKLDQSTKIFETMIPAPKKEIKEFLDNYSFSKKLGFFFINSKDKIIDSAVQLIFATQSLFLTYEMIRMLKIESSFDTEEFKVTNCSIEIY